MNQFTAELVGCAIALLFCYSGGRLAIRALRLPLTILERHLYSLPLGAALASLLVLLLGVAHLLYPAVLLTLTTALCICAWWSSRRRLQPAETPTSALQKWLRNVWLAVYVVFGYFYLRVALLPESSADGTRYHTSLIARYLRDHALVPVFTNMYAGLPQGAESVYLIAFAFGRNSAAALVDCAFLLMFPWLVLATFLRWKRPGAGVLSAILLFTCPVVAFAGTSAYIDTFLMVVLFAMFGLLEIYRERPSTGIAIAAGALAGYAFAVKYTAFPALVYLVLVMVFPRFEHWRKAAIACVCATVLFAPWLIRNAVFYRNPLFPFSNRVFPNPYMEPVAEMAYRRDMHVYTGIHSLAQLPTEYTIHGYFVQSFIGPVFLLLPLALIALRYPFGRRLLLASALMLYGVTQNMGTRFLMPSLTFAAPALALALADFGWIAVVAGAFAAFTCWPSNYNKYVEPLATRIAGFPKHVPISDKARETFLLHSVGDLYESVGLLNRCVPADARVLSYHDLPDGYVHAEVVVSYGGALNQRFYTELRTAVTPSLQPTDVLTFRVPPGSDGSFRLQQISHPGPQPASIAEVNVFKDGRPQQLSGLTSHPDPWDATLTVDSNPITRWSTWEPIRPDMFLGFTASGADTITVRLSPDQDVRCWRLETAGRVAAPQIDTAAITGNLKQYAARDLVMNGVRYLLIRTDDAGEPVTENIKAHAESWPVRLIGETPHYRLYEFEPKQL